MDLNHQCFETQTSGNTLVILHGLFGSARNWRGLARQLSDAYKVIVVDMPNHGGSPWLDHADYVTMADAIAVFMDTEGLAGATVLGHSMGGKAAMVLSMARPDLVAGLIVADIAPVPYAHRNDLYIEAMEAVDLTILKTRSDADAQLAQYVEDAGLRGFFLLNLVQEGEEFHWRINLTGLKQMMPALQSFPHMADGSLYGGPTLFLGGERSSFILPKHLTVIRSYFPYARHKEIRGAGHWIHTDQPMAVDAAIREFLSS